MAKNVQKSRDLQKTCKKNPRKCYYNAAFCAPAFPETTLVVGVMLIKDDYTYVDHAWLDENGVVVDPTCPDEDFEYHMGFEITVDELERARYEDECGIRSLGDYFRNGHPNSAYFRAAEAKAIEAGYKLVIPPAST